MTISGGLLFPEACSFFAVQDPDDLAIIIFWMKNNNLIKCFDGSFVCPHPFVDQLCVVLIETPIRSLDD